MSQSDLLNTDGSPMWFPTTQAASTVTTTIVLQDPNFFTLLYENSIQTNVLNQSIKVVQDGEILCHIILDDITSIDLIDNLIQINTEDDIPYYLQFVGRQDAVNASQRIDDAINGSYIADSDQLLNKTYSLKDFSTKVVPLLSFSPFPCLIFSDITPLFEALDKNDLVQKMNSLYPNYIFSVSGNDIQYSIDYNASDGNKIPTDLFFVTTSFTVFLTKQNVSFSIDYLTTDFYWILYESIILQNKNSFSFSNILPNYSFKLYYTNSFLSFIDLSNLSITSIGGALPSDLRKMIINNNNSINTNFLSNLSNLQEFEMKISTVSSLTNLNGLQKIETVTIETSQITTLPSLNNLPALKTFRFKDSKVTNIPTFTASTDLVYLEFTNCPNINTLSSLNYPFLKTLIVDYSNFTTLSANFDTLVIINTIIFRNSNLTSLPSLDQNIIVSYLDFSNNNLTATELEVCIDSILNFNTMNNGTLIFQNQQTPLDYTTFSTNLKTKIDILQNLRHWVVLY